MGKKAPYIILLVVIILAYLVVGSLDRVERYQPKTQTVIETVDEPKAPIKVQKAVVTYNKCSVRDKLTAIQQDKLIRVNIAATGCCTYAEQQLTAICQANRYIYYGDTPLLWNFVEIPFDMEKAPEKDRAERLLQYESCKQALIWAFNNLDKYPYLFYYQNPVFSSDAGLKEFEGYEFAIRRGDVWAYNIEPECREMLKERRNRYINE